MWLLLHFRLSAGMRNLAERITRFRPLQTALYWIQFIIVISIINFPLTVYEGYFREHKYALSNIASETGCATNWWDLRFVVVLGAILMIPLFGVVRRLPEIGGCGALRS